MGVSVGTRVGSGVAVGLGEGVGVGSRVGMGFGLLGKSSVFLASETTRVRVDLLYFPAAKILLPTNPDKSILSGTSKLIASEDVVTR